MNTKSRLIINKYISNAQKKTDTWLSHASRSEADKALSHYKDSLPKYEVSIIKIRRSWDPLIFTMEIHILVRRLIYIETASRLQTKRNAIINSVYPKPISKWINALRPDYTKSKHKSMMIQHKIGEKSTNASNCGGINMINMYIGSTSLNASGWATSVLNDGKSQIIETAVEYGQSIIWKQILYAACGRKITISAYLHCIGHLQPAQMPWSRISLQSTPVIDIAYWTFWTHFMQNTKPFFQKIHFKMLAAMISKSQCITYEYHRGWAIIKKQTRQRKPIMTSDFYTWVRFNINTCQRKISL